MARKRGESRVVEISEHFVRAEVAPIADEGLVVLPKRILHMGGWRHRRFRGGRPGEEELGPGQVVDNVASALARTTRHNYAHFVAGATVRSQTMSRRPRPRSSR
jgi:hypothetical protein